MVYHKMWSVLSVLHSRIKTALYEKIGAGKSAWKLIRFIKITQYTYGLSQNVVCITDPTGKKEQYQYDKEGINLPRYSTYPASAFSYTVILIVSLDCTATSIVSTKGTSFLGIINVLLLASYFVLLHFAVRNVVVEGNKHYSAAANVIPVICGIPFVITFDASTTTPLLSKYINLPRYSTYPASAFSSSLIKILT